MTLFASRNRRLPRRPALPRLTLERLEDRTLLSASPAPAALQPGYGQLPLAFTVNEGQAAPSINYLAQGSGYSVALTAQQAQLGLGQGQTSTTLNLRLVGANASAQAAGQDQLITKTNYLTGNDPSKWLTNVANYGQVEYQGVYQGVDAVYSGNQGQLETTFLVHPGANANVIQMQIQGTEGLTLDAHGDLVIHTAGGDVTEQAPVMYQDVNGTRQAVSGRYVLEGGDTVGFQVGAYDHSQTLVIDPTLSYSSYLPSMSNAVAVDSSGNAYFVTGSSVDKLNAAGTVLLWQTNLGISPGGAGTGIAVDASGNVYITGWTRSTSFATTSNALDRTKPTTGVPNFLTVINPSGSKLLYSTWIPGTAQGAPGNGGGSLYGPALAIDNAGNGTGHLDNVYLTGWAISGLPTTAGAYQSTDAGGNGDAFLLKINPNLSGSASLAYGSYLGGSGNDVGAGIAVDSSGNAYVVGRTNSTSFPTTAGAFQQQNAGGYDVFVSKINPSLSGSASLVYSTYLGGNGTDGYVSSIPGYTNGTYGQTLAVAVDSSGDAYVTGATTSTNFPTTPGAFQTTYTAQSSGWGMGEAFVTKLNATGTGLIYSTYLGGSDNTAANAIAVDASGNAYVTGWTRSSDFPTVNPIQASKAVGNDSAGDPNSDAFVTTLNAAGTGLLFSTYLGGTNDDYGIGLALDSADNVYVTGYTLSSNFPTTAGAYQTSGGGFVFKIDPPAGGSPALQATVSSASGVVASSGRVTANANNPQGQESNGQLAPSQAGRFFTLVGNNPGISSTLSAWSGLPSEAQALDSSLLARFDALLSMGFGAFTHHDVQDTFSVD